MQNISKRVLKLSELYDTNIEFLEKCGIKNRSLLSELKAGRMKYPGADVLVKIVEGTGCSGSWLLTGKGEMFDKDHKVHSPKDIVTRALLMLTEVENHTENIEVQNLPRDLEIRLSELLLKVLQNRQ